VCENLSPRQSGSDCRSLLEGLELGYQQRRISQSLGRRVDIPCKPVPQIQVAVVSKELGADFNTIDSTYPPTLSDLYALRQIELPTLSTNF
jgi:hypothetical protein